MRNWGGWVFRESGSPHRPLDLGGGVSCVVLDGNLLEQPQGWATGSEFWSDSAPAILGSDPLSLGTQGGHQGGGLGH